MFPPGFLGLVFDPTSLTTYTASSKGFQPVSLDLQGRVLISPGSSIVIVGTDTPTDARANPTTDVPVTAFAMAWDPDAGGGGLWRRQVADSAGNLVTIGGAPPAEGSTGCARELTHSGENIDAGHISGPGKLLAMQLSCNAVGGAWFMLFDLAAPPALSDVPFVCVYVPASGGFVTQLGREHFGEYGRPLNDGLSWGMSTTPTSYTPSVEFDGSINVSVSV